jgi:Secretion system C-terminal sorting domain
MKSSILFFLMLILALNMYSEEVIPMFKINPDSFTGSVISNNISYESTRDELLNTYSLFNESSGIYPTDICYAQNHNKIFVYGQRVIKVFDATTYAQLDEIDISTFGHLETFNCVNTGNGNASPYHDYRILYANDRIFCITEGLELLMIDVNTYEIIDIQQRPICIGDSEKIGNMILKHNVIDNRIYWVINDYDSTHLSYTGDNAGGRLAIYDIVDNIELNIAHEMEFSGWNNIKEDNFIRDIEFNPISNFFYLSVNHEIIVYSTDSALNFGFVESYQTIHFAGLLEVIYDGNIHNLICFPIKESGNSQNANITTIDLDTYDSTIVTTNYSDISSTSIDYVNNRIYLVHNSGQNNRIMSLNYVNNILNESFYILDWYLSYEILFVEEVENLYICTDRSVIIVDCSTTIPSLINEYNDGNMHWNLDKGNDKIWIVDLEECSLEVYNLSGTIINSIHIGEDAYRGIISGRADRIFMFKTYGDRLSIFNMTSGLMEFFDFPGNIVDIDVDDINFRIFILDSYGIVRIYNSTTMILQNTFIMDNNDPWGFPLLFDIHYYNGYLYAGGIDGVDIWNLDQPGLSHISFQNCSAYDFMTDYENQRVMAIAGFIDPVFPNPGQSNILILDGFNSPISYPIPANRNEFEYDNVNNKIYFLGADELGDHVYSLHLFTGEITSILSASNEYFLYLEYSYEQNKLYVNALEYSFLHNKIYVVDIGLLDVTETIDIPLICSQIYYNDYSNKLYVLNLHDWSEDYEMNMLAIEVENNNTLTSIPLTFKERLKGTGISFWGFKGCKSIIPYGDRLFLVRGNNVLQEIVCYPTETKILSRGWNWESFPRLERLANENVNIVPILETIQNYGNINLLDMLYETDLLHHTSPPNYWFPGSFDIYSTNLYKIDVDPEDDWILELAGTRLPSDYFFPEGEELEAETYHWLGYWLPQTQDMDVAFGEFWEFVEEVKAEEWYYGPQPSGGRDLVIGHKPSLKMRALEYGKGYEVKFSEEISGFQWFTSTEAAEEYERSSTENFTFEEQPDYEVIDILEIPENVVEIGVFQDSVCVGAVAVQDTCEQILVYVDNSSRDQVPYNFEVVTNNRSLQEVLNYMVFNKDDGIFENRSLIAGSQPYSIIKFGNMGDPQNEPPIIDKVKLHGNYPNPFNPVTNISFSLPKEQRIELAIYNLKGQKVTQLANGRFSSGEHKVTWDGKDNHDKKVASGLYFYKLKTDDNELTKKMLLLK